MSTKSWKSHLLSSGVPLEYAVIDVLDQLFIKEPIEYTYERKNEVGRDTEFSVDVFATTYLDKTATRCKFLIECKYRHDSIKWVFTPFHLSESEAIELEVAIDDFAIDRSKTNFLLDSFYSISDLCYKGIEVSEKDSNSESIKKAVYQIRYAMPDLIYEEVSSQIRLKLSNSKYNFPAVLIRLIVTTAELWQIKSGTSLEDFKSANEIDEVAVKKNMIILHDRPGATYVKYAAAKFISNFDIEEIDLANKYSEGIIDYIAEKYFRFPTDLYIVVGYNYLKETLENLISVLDETNSSFDVERSGE